MRSNSEWSAATLTQLLVAAGIAQQLHAEIGVLFREEMAPPACDRAGAPDHPDTPCLIWRGGSVRSGYGMVRCNGRMRQVHSVVYELVTGNPAPTTGAGTVLAHLCENPPCAHPGHYRVATTQENSAEGRSTEKVHDVRHLAPPALCRQCGGDMVPTVQMRGANRPAWAYRCNPCYRAYRRLRKQGVVGPLWSGQITRPMDDDACTAIAGFVNPVWRSRRSRASAVAS